MWPLIEPRSHSDYDDYDDNGTGSSTSWTDVIWFPIIAIGLMVFIPLYIAFVFLWFALSDIHTNTQKTFQSGELSYPFLGLGGVVLFTLGVSKFLDDLLTPAKPIATGLFILVSVLLLACAALPLFALAGHWLSKGLLTVRGKLASSTPLQFLVPMVILCVGIVSVVRFGSSLSVQPPPPKPLPAPTKLFIAQAPTPPTAIPPTVQPPQPPLPTPSAQPKITISPIITRSIWLDDFKPQPYAGDTVYFFNRWEGDRGALNDSKLAWGNGLVTTTIASGNSWGGIWMSLNHPIREGLSVNFSAILPAPIVPEYQSQITGITVRIAGGTPNRIFRLELKNGNTLHWKNEITLKGGQQIASFDLPALGNLNQLVWVLDRASPGDFVTIESVAFTTTTRITDTATAAFVWSYGMLLNNWNPATGLVRDKAKDASGEFDAVQATGCLAAATAIAQQLGVVTRADAVQIVNRINDALLALPRFHGLLPHFVQSTSAGIPLIVEHTEWSSVDTVIAGVGLLTAQSSLGLDTSRTEQWLRSIEWNALKMPEGITQGFTFEGKRIPWAWDVFGGESWLVELVYAGATGEIAPIPFPSPPTANGSGFIDELAWLFVPPPSKPDHWGTDWTSYRDNAADKQKEYNSTSNPKSCLSQLGLFGLSAGEVPAPSMVPKDKIYQSFGVGGRFSPANDGVPLLESPVAVPHYSAMIASRRPEQAIKMWSWLIENDFFTPLTNVESLVFSSDCTRSNVSWNQLKGSWNLALQTLGWGRYLAERRSQVPALWQATTANPLLQNGYALLAPSEQWASPAPIATPTAKSGMNTWRWTQQCENSNEATIGQTLDRSNASGAKAHGLFGAIPGDDWRAKPGYVKYNIALPTTEHLYLELRYSKHSSSNIPILIYIGNEQNPRAAIYPIDQEDWNKFISTQPIDLGKVSAGNHAIRFYTVGQQYGVADLDEFSLTGEYLQPTPTQPSAPLRIATPTQYIRQAH